MFEERIEKKLIDLKLFTPVEAKVYLTLLKHGALNGSRLAKLLGMSRSSTYTILNKLHKLNFINLIPGSPTLYKAEDPENLLEKNKNDYLNMIQNLKKEIKSIHKQEEEEKQYFNISGYDNFIAKLDTYLQKAENEVFVNTNMPELFLEKTFSKLKKKGVRVILFSFKDVKTENKFIEKFTYDSIYKYEARQEKIRIMLSIDSKYAFMGEGKIYSNFTGVYSSNPLLVSIVSEHIHHDIVLNRLNEKYNFNFSDSDIFINSSIEKNFHKSWK